MQAILVSNKNKPSIIHHKAMSLWIVLSGENPNKDCIVGYSFSFDKENGYYVPVNHDSGNNVTSAMDYLSDTIKNSDIVFLYGGVTVFRFLRCNGIDDSFKYYDVSVGVFLSDTNIKSPSIEYATKQFLNYELQLSNYNYRYVSPQYCYEVMGTIAVLINNLYSVTYQYYLESGCGGIIENEFIRVLSALECSEVSIDSGYVNYLYDRTSEVLKDLKDKIFASVGYQFNLNAPVMLERAISENKTIIPMTKEYSSVNVLFNSYIKNIKESCKDDIVRFHYKAQAVPTCRLSSGTDRWNDYFAKLNIQSFPKPKKCLWYVHDYNGEKYSDDDVVIDRWRFSLTDKSNTVIKGYDRSGNVRNAIKADNDSYIVSMDYETQELRILANYSGEQSWVDAFNNGFDLHKMKAEFFWGKENYTEEKRDLVKALNYGINYGMSSYTLAKDIGIQEEEADKLYKQYCESIPAILRFQKSCIEYAKKNGVIYNAFGIPRRVSKWLNSSDFKQRKFGERTVLNTVVQSVGAIVLKIALIKLYRDVYNNDSWKDDCKFVNTIHDEINSVVKKSRLFDCVMAIKKCMEYKADTWKVPLTVGIELGARWGETFPFKIIDGLLLPDCKSL